MNEPNHQAFIGIDVGGTHRDAASATPVITLRELYRGSCAAVRMGAAPEGAEFPALRHPQRERREVCS